jgi:quinol monooxygenase YgiN
LPETGLVLFTIRTHMVPMIRWQSTPGAIAALVDMLDKMSEAARNYKGAHLYRDALQQSLINS